MADLQATYAFGEVGATPRRHDALARLAVASFVHGDDAELGFLGARLGVQRDLKAAHVVAGGEDFSPRRDNATTTSRTRTTRLRRVRPWSSRVPLIPNLSTKTIAKDIRGFF